MNSGVEHVRDTLFDVLNVLESHGYYVRRWSNGTISIEKNDIRGFFNFRIPCGELPASILFDIEAKQDYILLSVYGKSRLEEVKRIAIGLNKKTSVKIKYLLKTNNKRIHYPAES